MKKKVPDSYWFASYQYNKMTSFGFGRCFVTNLKSLPKLEESLRKDNPEFVSVCIISITPLTKAQFKAFEKEKFL